MLIQHLIGYSEPTPLFMRSCITKKTGFLNPILAQIIQQKSIRYLPIDPNRKEELLQESLLKELEQKWVSKLWDESSIHAQISGIKRVLN